MSDLESWQKGPTKIISEAIKHGRKKTDEDNFLSFLLLDVGMEMVFKTYLTLPKHLTGANTSDDERNLASRKGFHDVLDAVKKSRHGINSHDLGRVGFFHVVRNKLYHQGNGLTVPQEHVEEYINVAMRLIKNLLKFDIVPLVSLNGLSSEEQENLLNINQSIDKNINTAIRLKVELDNAYELAVEKISSELVMPSFKKKFEHIKESAYSEDEASFDGEKVFHYKALPRDTEKRLSIVNDFRALCDDFIKKSQFSELLLADYELKSTISEEHIRARLGVKNANIEHEVIPAAYSVVFDQYFDLKIFYMNLVNLVLYGDNNLSGYLSYFSYRADGFIPISYDEDVIDYSKKIKCFSNEQISDLERYIKNINFWLSDIAEG